jgi:hypothetical protein
MKYSYKQITVEFVQVAETMEAYDDKGWEFVTLYKVDDPGWVNLVFKRQFDRHPARKSVLTKISDSIHNAVPSFPQTSDAWAARGNDNPAR